MLFRQKPLKKKVPRAPNLFFNTNFEACSFIQSRILLCNNGGTFHHLLHTQIDFCIINSFLPTFLMVIWSWKVYCLLPAACFSEKWWWLGAFFTFTFLCPYRKIICHVFWRKKQLLFLGPSVCGLCWLVFVDCLCTYRYMYTNMLWI